MTKYGLLQIVGLLCIALTIAGCSKDISPSFSDDGDMKAGDPVMFTTHMSGKATSRGAYDGWGSAEGYTFTYFMYKSGVEAPILSDSTVYWPDINTNAYGFKAMTGTLKEGVTDGAFAELAANQSTEASLINEDQLLGFGAASNDIITALNYRTGTAWKSANDYDGITGENQKKIRLYMQHQRAKITIILKAGVGVLRSDLTYPASGVSVKIYSYKGATPTTTEITPYASSANIDYTASDYGGAAASVATTKYQAIVDPYDYRTGEGKNIAQITVGGRTFTYKPSNDTSGTGDYDLTAGKHLTITITLSPGAAMSASVTNWTESSTDATLEPDSNQRGHLVKVIWSFSISGTRSFAHYI